MIRSASGALALALLALVGDGPDWAVRAGVSARFGR